MALLGLLLDQANVADVRGIADKAPTGILVEDLAGVATLTARRFSAADIDGLLPKHHGADTTAQGVLIGVVDALERNQGRIRRHCFALKLF